MPAVGGTIADVSSSKISDSLRVVIGDAISPEESEESDSPPTEGKKAKKEKKGIFGSLFGANKVRIQGSKQRERPQTPSRSLSVGVRVLFGLELELELNTCRLSV